MEQLKLFAAERRLLTTSPDRVQVRLKDFELHRPRQWGGCWLFSELWKQLQLDEFWRVRLGCSREGTDWEHVLQTLVCYRLLDPGSEWHLHRVWFEQSAMGDLLAEDFSIAAKDTLYRCLDSLLEHKAELFDSLPGPGRAKIRRLLRRNAKRKSEMKTFTRYTLFLFFSLSTWELVKSLVVLRNIHFARVMPLNDVEITERQDQCRNPPSRRDDETGIRRNAVCCG